MDFSEALKLLIAGSAIRRVDWTEGTRLETQSIDMLDHPLIIMRDLSDDFVIYSATQADLFYEEWERYEE